MFKNTKIAPLLQNTLFTLLGAYIIYNFARSYKPIFVIEIALTLIFVILIIHLAIKPAIKLISKKEFTIKIKIIWLIASFVLLNILIFSLVYLFSDSQTLFGFILLIFSLIIKILGPLLIAIIATAIGLIILKKIKAQSLPIEAQFFFAFGIGMGLLGISSFFLALAQQSNIYSSIILLLILFLIGLKEILILLQRIQKYNLQISINLEKHWLIFFWFLLLVVIEIAFLCSLTDILAANWDSFHQYLTFPMEYLKNGGLKQFLWHPGWGYPQLGEMLFLFFATLFGVDGPFLINYLFFLSLIIATFYFTRKYLPSKLQPYIVSFLISSPFVVRLIFTHIKIDIIYFFYCLLIFILLKIILNDDEKITLKNNTYNILLGLLLGLMLSLKYISLFTGTAIFFALLILSKEKIQLLKRSVLVFFIALCVMSPWLIKNVSVYHNPLYPLLPGKDAVFMATGKMCTSFFQDSAAHDMPLIYSSLIKQTGIKILDNLNMFITSITRLSNIDSLRFVGMWFILLLPFILFYAFKWKYLNIYSKLLLTFTGIFFFFWAIFMIGAVWYFFPGLLALFLFASTNLQPQKLSSLIKNIIIITAFLGLAVIFKHTPNLQTLKYASKNHDAKEIVFTKGDWLETNNYVNELLSSNKNTRIYSFMEPRGYFIKNSSEQFILDYYGEKFNCFNTANNVKNDLKKLNAQYILFSNQKNIDCKNLPNPNVNKLCQTLYDFEDFLKKENLPIIYENGSYKIYEL